MKLGKVLLVACALLALGPAAARGQLVRDCREDVRRLCSDVPMGGGRILRCLEDKAAELSPTCKKAIGARGAPSGSGAAAGGADGTGSAGRQAVKTACRDDALRLCSESIGDQPKMKSCLQSHAAELSDGCKTAIIAAGG